jgi:serine/threonine protein kinase
LKKTSPITEQQSETEGKQDLKTRIAKTFFRDPLTNFVTTIDCYRVGKVLGRGAFGKVNLAVHKLTKKFVAIKSINKQYLNVSSPKKDQDA